MYKIPARASAGKTFLPIFLGVNFVYLAIRFGFSSIEDFNMWSYLGIFLLLGLNWLCYTSILDSASNTTSSTSSKDLPGGVWLDVVAIVWLTQLATTFWSSLAYYLLLVLPPMAAYKVYDSFQSPKGTVSGKEKPASEEAVSEEVQQRRQKRADRRRQKRI